MVPNDELNCSRSAGSAFCILRTCRSNWSRLQCNAEMALLTVIMGIFVVVSNSFEVDGTIASSKHSGKIVIASNGNDSNACLSDETSPCRSIGYVLRSRHLNNTLIWIENGIYPLNETAYIENISNLTITGAQRNNRPVIKCGGKNTSTSSGIFFRFCAQITLTDLEVQLCGANFTSTSRRNGTTVYSHVAVFMENSENITWRGIKVSNSSGIGTVFYDVTGKVDFQNVTFEENAGQLDSLDNSTRSLKSYVTGGGINIEFRPTSSTKQSDYIFSNCNFSNNIADDTRNNVISDSVNQSFFSLGRGGGISFISRGDRKGNRLTLDSCFFYNNSALWGAGIFTEINDRSGDNHVKIVGSVFSGNRAIMAGGAIRFGINSNNKMGINSIEVHGSTFSENQAKVGGAVSDYQLRVQKKGLILIDNCTFQANAASVASDIHIQRLNVTLVNIVIRYHSLTTSNLNSEGSLFCFASHLYLKGENLITGAENTGFILDFCNMVLHGTANFSRNNGVNGGALMMYSHSSIRFTTGSRLILHYNSAKQRGGAIYVETPVPLIKGFKSTQLNIYRCFFLFGDREDELKPADSFNATIDFLGNVAGPKGGSNVWATTISWCRGKDEPLFNNTALKWEMMKSNGKKFATNTSVVTNPHFIVYNRDQWSAYPGITMHAHVTLRDENWNIVSGTVRIQINSTDVSLNGPRADFIADDVAIKLIGASGSKYSVTLKALGRISTSTTINDLNLKGCKPGFHMKDNSCICQSIDKGVTHCDTATQSVYIIPSRWGNTHNDKEFARLVCPTHYCKSCDDSGPGCLFNSNDQCAKGRDPTSTLCGKCKESFSVHLGAETCTECKSDQGLLWIIFFMVVISFVVFLIMLVNLDAYSTYLNGFLYSYQIIPLLITDQEYTDVFISMIMAVTNVSGIGKVQKGVCIWKRMNNMDKLLLNYLAPFYFIASTVLFGALSSLRNRCPFNKNATFRAFVFISVIAYADFTKLTFKILQPVEVNGLYYAYYAAYMPYFGKEHAPYAAVAVLVFLFVVIGFPFALLFPNHVIRFPRLVRLMAIFDTFQEPFKDGPYFKMFPAFYFVTRFVLLVLKISIKTGPVQDVIFAMACVVILIIFIICKPYRDWKMNFFDGLQLANIVFMAIVFTAIGVAYEDGVRRGLKKVNWALAYIPLICVTYRTAVWISRKITNWRSQNARGKWESNHNFEGKLEVMGVYHLRILLILDRHTENTQYFIPISQSRLHSFYDSEIVFIFWW